MRSTSAEGVVTMNSVGSRIYAGICAVQRRLVNLLTGQLFRRMEGYLYGEAKEARKLATLAEEQATAARIAAERAEIEVREAKEMVQRLLDSHENFMLSAYKKLGELENDKP